MYSYPTDASKVTTMQSVSEGAFISLSNTFRNTMAITLKKERKKKKKKKRKEKKASAATTEFSVMSQSHESQTALPADKTMVVS